MESSRFFQTDTEISEIEKEILWVFGKSIIEFESVLYVKFHTLTTEFILSEEQLRLHLMNLEQKGYVAFASFMGKRSWRKL